MKQLLNSVLIAVFCLQLTACSDSPVLTPLSKDSIVLAFGDSLTEGLGASNPKTESYPSILRQLSGIPIINSGISGELSKDGLIRLEEELDEYEPDLIILCHGGNDLIRKLDKDTLKQNLRQMILTAKNSGAEVVLIGVPSFNLIAKVPDLYAELAAEFDLPYQSDVMRQIELSPRLKSDPIHPNSEGYKRLAEAVFELLKKSKAL